MPTLPFGLRLKNLTENEKCMFVWKPVDICILNNLFFTFIVIKIRLPARKILCMVMDQPDLHFELYRKGGTRDIFNPGK